MPFTFLLALGVFAVAILWVVDVDKSRAECRAYLEDEATKVYGINLKNTSTSIGVLAHESDRSEGSHDEEDASPEHKNQ